MAKRIVGVQLIIFGKQIQENLAGVLDAVAAAGYQAVETGYLGGRVGGREFKKMLDDRGLVHVGAHLGGTQLDDVAPILDWLKETGGIELPVSGSELRNGASLEIYRQRAAVYNAAGAKCRAAGITLSYHNHNWEFQMQDGVLPLELLYAETDPANVKACIDTYWVRDGGGDPAAFVRKHAARLRILHCKDSYLPERGQRSFAPVGAGVVDFPAVFQALGASPCPWIVVEQDFPNPGQTAESCCAASRKYLREVIKV